MSRFAPTSAHPTRRSVLTGTGATLAALAMPGTMRVTFAAGPADAPLVVILLRGGLDGLAFLPPHGDPAYADARGGLALPPPGVPGGILDLDGAVGLHPAAGALLPLWASGEAAFAPAVATPYAGTSHEEAIGILDSGMPVYSPDAEDGWINRAIAASGAAGGDGGADVLALGHDLPLAVRGPAAAEPWVRDRLMGPGAGFTAKVGALYELDPFLTSALQAAMGSRETRYATLGTDHRTADTSGWVPSALALMAGPVAERLRDPTAPNVAVIEIGGWDTHHGQGTAEGPLARSIAGLSEGISALSRALSDRWQDSMILVASEFGRTAAPNDNGGTDHGHATVAMAFGGGLSGGIFGGLPSLAAGNLSDHGGVSPTLDTRAFLKGALAHHWSLSTAALDTRVFPDSASARAVSGF